MNDIWILFDWEVDGVFRLSNTVCKPSLYTCDGCVSDVRAARQYAVDTVAASYACGTAKGIRRRVGEHTIERWDPKLLERWWDEYAWAGTDDAIVARGRWLWSDRAR